MRFLAQASLEKPNKSPEGPPILVLSASIHVHTIQIVSWMFQPSMVPEPPAIRYECTLLS